MAIISMDKAVTASPRRQIGTMACIFMRQVSPSLVALMTIDEMIVMSVQVDPKLPKAEDNAHYEAMGNIRGPNGVTLRADWDGMNAALNRVFASAPRGKVVDVYNLVSSIAWCRRQ